MRRLALSCRAFALLAWAAFLLLATPVRGELHLATIEVSNVVQGFRVFDSGNPLLGVASDRLVASSNAPSVAVNFDTEDTFVLKISAPIGKKFWVHAQPERTASFQVRFLWQVTSNFSWAQAMFGNCSVTFGDFVGILPPRQPISAVYSPSQGFFGFPAFALGPMSNDFTFTSITLTGVVPHSNPNRGIRTYFPDCLFTCEQGQSMADRRPVISLIPVGEPVDAVVPIGEALETDPSVVWSTIGGGPNAWSGRLLVTHDGFDAVQSGEVTNGAAITLQRKANGPATLTWWWKVSSELSKDFLKMFVDGVQQDRISGELDWQQKSVLLAPGPHVLKWTYSKDATNSGGQDKGWIDEVRLEPDTNCVFSLSAAGRAYGFGAATDSVSVVTSAGCPWFVLCTNSWIVATSPIANRGNGSVRLGVLKNPTTSARTGIVSVAGLPFAVTQAAGPTNEPWRGILDAMDVRSNPYFVDARPGGHLVEQGHVTHDGTDAVQIGAYPFEDRTVSVHAGLVGPGTLSFWWKVSSETNLDLLKFFGPDGEVRLSGEVDWQFRSVRIPPEGFEVFWAYAKDDSHSVGNDRGWIDQVQFFPETNCLVRISPTSRQHGLGAETGSVQVLLLSNCNWSAWTTFDWIQFELSINNPANGVLNYRLATNFTGQARTGSILLGDQVFSILQSNGACQFAVSPATVVHDWQRETGILTLTVSAPLECPWSFVSTNDWISFHSSVPLGSGARIAYTVNENPGAFPRTGSIRLGTAQGTILQQGKPGAPLSNTRVLGTNHVATIGHAFTRLGPDPSLVSDFLLDQGQASGGGATLPSLVVGWDADSQFAWRISAPPGMKFRVRPPPGANARFEGALHWDSSGSGAISPGFAAASFDGISGFSPLVTGTASLSDIHGSFGLTLDSVPFTNAFSFISMTLAWQVFPRFTGLGSLNFNPRLDSALRVVHESAQTNDPGPFVSLVPRDPPLNLSIVTDTRTNGVVLMLQGPGLLTNIIQFSSDLVQWIPIHTNTMPDTDCPACPSVLINDRTTNVSRRFYRAVQQ